MSCRVTYGICEYHRPVADYFPETVVRPLLFVPYYSRPLLFWISGTAPTLNHPYAAKTRYRQADAACHLTESSEERCTIKFDESQWAVTLGQSVVVYDGEVCLGGAIIEQGVQ